MSGTMESDESTSEVSFSSSTSSTLIEASNFHTTYKSLDDVPYTHVSILGEGSFGFVDKVVGVSNDKDGRKPLFFARKRIRLQRTQYKLERQMRLIRSEVEIVKKLSHPNITSICSTYECGTEFGMLITPIAEGDLKEFMEELDEMPAGATKLRRQVELSSWIGSLVDALSYLHSLPICHKDLKPANILVKEGTVYITDFGIARDLINETTTASTGTVAFKSPMYSAPEVLLAGRRGRASDVYSMGCVFLELLTLASDRSLLKFNNYRTTGGTRAYANNEKKVVNWAQDIISFPGQLPSRDEVRRLTMMCFLMLAPAPKERITMAEVARGLEYFGLSEDSSDERKTLFKVRRQRRVDSSGNVSEHGYISIAVQTIRADGRLTGYRLNDHSPYTVFSMSCAIEPSVLNLLHEESTTSDLAGESELQNAWLRAPNLYFFNPRTDCRTFPDVPTTWIENARTKARARHTAPMWTFIRLLNFEGNQPLEKQGEISWESARTMMSTVLPFRRADGDPVAQSANPYPHSRRSGLPIPPYSIPREDINRDRLLTQYYQKQGLPVLSHNSEADKPDRFANFSFPDRQEKSEALDSLAAELEALRSQWETNSKSSS